MDSALVGALVNFGMGGAVILAIILGYLVPKPTVDGLREENAELKAANAEYRRALDLERQRSDAAIQVGSVTNQLIGALANLAHEQREQSRPAPPPPRQLTGEDLGL